jgi:hypothetical protein
VKNIINTFKLEHTCKDETKEMSVLELVKHVEEECPDYHPFSCPNEGCAQHKEQMKETVLKDHLKVCTFISVTCTDCEKSFDTKAIYNDPEQHKCAETLKEKIASLFKTIEEQKLEVAEQKKLKT